MNLLDAALLEANIKNRITADIESGRVAGAAVCVLQNGRRIYRNFFGYSDPNTQSPLSETHLFRMASMTKPVTAVCVLIAAEKGLLGIDDPISKYIPEFSNMSVGEKIGENVVFKESADKEITIDMLLSHKSGIGSGDTASVQMSKMSASDKLSIETAVNFYKKMLLDFQPGEYEKYSPVAAFDILARIIEITSGITFAEFADTYVFKPLGMYDTTFTPTSEQWQRIVKMSDFKNGKSVVFPMPKCTFSDFPSSYTCGGAGLVSSLDDYAKFAQMLLQGGVYDNVRVISNESLKLMCSPNPPVNKSQMYDLWGLGVRVNQNNFYDRIPSGTFGWSGAYGTHFFVDTANEIVAVYMKNSQFDGGSGASTAANFEQDVYNALK